MVALARLALPQSHVRMSAGRQGMSEAAQALCFYAGANSLFWGDYLLTAANAPLDRDRALLTKLGLEPELPHDNLLHPAATEALFSEEEPHPCLNPGPCRGE